MPNFNIYIHPSAHFYHSYLCAFFLAHFPNVQIYNATTIESCDYVHCVIVYKVQIDELKSILKPYTKIMCISGEPHEIFMPFLHLVVDCKKDKSLRPSHIPFVYLPFYVMSFAERIAHPHDLLLPPNFDALVTMKQKTKFCAFMYSHAVEDRDRFFDVLSRRYKSVDALGTCRNTSGKSSTRTLYDPLVKTYYEDAVEQYIPYKFVIAIENGRIDGYVTEKLMNAVLARAVPIYLGAPDIFHEGIFNPKAIIHVGDFKSFEDCAEHIRQVDQNPELYLQYLREPIFLGNKLPNYFDTSYLLPHILRLFGMST